ncbi:glycosyltransferase [Dyadobacter aurulentus]|uniref:glycosyltransferase n=1 Tax=Dyadobacter sp. UC 10 TaxID=2605428 RepID=UPI001CECF467|nr:glycosyltransferase [Dyadobacter sp. UC 10]
MTRFAQNGNVFFLEEPLFDASENPYIQFEKKLPGLSVCVPHLPPGCTGSNAAGLMEGLLRSFFEERGSTNFIFWYYTPMAFEFSKTFQPELIVYDCMDELSAFKFAPAGIRALEQQLLAKADVVFTGGFTLYEAKKSSHPNIHPFPSSIDKTHFQSAREALAEPQDQAAISGVKLGFYGVIDERFDQELIRVIAAKRPEWQIILIGPIVKIDPAELPAAGNIHYLGCKNYIELPAYLSGWNVALIPFLINESTQFISPTKTPEYLAAGRPVVSTPIRDVVFPYGKSGLVSIGKDADTFISAIEYELGNLGNTDWLQAVDTFLSDKSWEDTYSSMLALMHAAARHDKAVALTIELKNAS